MRRFKIAIIICLISAAAYAQGVPVGEIQPDFTATDMHGEQVSLSALRGKVVVLNLWFINCPNCLAEIKELNGLADEYKGRDDIVFLAPAASGQAELQAFLKKHPFKYRIVPDAAALILSKFGIAAPNGELYVLFPMHIVIDRDGKLTVSERGAKGIAAVRSEIKRLLPRN
ncbi:MAG: TlpA family protein disulfide reductase [Chloracidobacterium sp.]|nr:TlpA family protein disulfide reductase [Chloracidobacterium sp.]MCO5334167.1 TlpA family protein disulfide reductase [Pyrinomonadaceae bacterium]